MLLAAAADPRMTRAAFDKLIKAMGRESARTKDQDMGQTPLHAAAGAGRLDLVQVLSVSPVLVLMFRCSPASPFSASSFSSCD